MWDSMWSYFRSPKQNLKSTELRLRPLGLTTSTPFRDDLADTQPIDSGHGVSNSDPNYYDSTQDIENDYLETDDEDQTTPYRRMTDSSASPSLSTGIFGRDTAVKPNDVRKQVPGLTRQDQIPRRYDVTLDDLIRQKALLKSTSTRKSTLDKPKVEETQEKVGGYVHWQDKFDMYGDRRENAVQSSMTANDQYERDMRAQFTDYRSQTQSDTMPTYRASREAAKVKVSDYNQAEYFDIDLIEPIDSKERVFRSHTPVSKSKTVRKYPKIHVSTPRPVYKVPKHSILRRSTDDEVEFMTAESATDDIEYKRSNRRNLKLHRPYKMEKPTREEIATFQRQRESEGYYSPGPKPRVLSYQDIFGTPKSHKIRKERRIYRSKPKKKEETSSSDTYSSDKNTSDSDTSTDEGQKAYYTKPPKFNGMGWPTYILRFEACAQLNNWSNRDKAKILRTCLDGDTVLSLQSRKSKKWSYKRLVKELGIRYEGKLDVDELERQLREKRQSQGQSYSAFYDQIYALAIKLRTTVRETEATALRVFKAGVREPNLRSYLVQEKPKDIAASHNCISMWEAMSRAAEPFDSAARLVDNTPMVAKIHSVLETQPTEEVKKKSSSTQFLTEQLRLLTSGLVAQKLEIEEMKSENHKLIDFIQNRGPEFQQQPMEADRQRYAENQNYNDRGYGNGRGYNNYRGNNGRYGGNYGYRNNRGNGGYRGDRNYQGSNQTAVPRPQEDNLKNENSPAKVQAVKTTEGLDPNLSQKNNSSS